MKALKTAILLGATMLATPAFAQDSAPKDKADHANRASDIVVTGSRIVRDGYQAPTPVTVAPVEDLVKSTPTNIADALNKLPQFTNSSSPARSSHNFANQPNHGNVLNLRGVGGDRTLILFDGIRVPPTTYVGTVDVSVIPNALVQRVDVATAGASAAYGSDAVAGVVNFVLNKKFTGISGTAQAGVSERGDSQNQRISMAFGTGVLGDKGHLLLSGEYYNNDGMLRSDREVARRDYVYLGSVPGSSSAPGSNADPYKIYENVRLVFANSNGLILGGPFGGSVLNDDGTLRPFNPGTATGTPGFAIGGDGFTIDSDVHAVAPLETYNAFGRFSYDVTPDLEFFVQGSWSRSNLSYISQNNSFVGLQNAPVFEGNPFIPAPIATALAADPTPDQRFDVAKTPAYLKVKPLTNERTDFWMVTSGLAGDLGTWKWRAEYTHGDSTHKVDQHGLYNYQRTYAALDAVRDGSGNIVCRPTLDPDPEIRARFAGCKPLNVFLSGPAYEAQPGYSYATGTMSYEAKIKHDAFSASIQGSPFDLPGGPVDIALGGEYRKQSLNLISNSDPSLLDSTAERNAYFASLRGVSGASLFYWLTNVGQAAGNNNVKEGFAEINLPILRDAPLAQTLTVNAAGRITDYSTSGTVKTWKVGAMWQPIKDITLRGTLSRDIRAPTLFDLFAGDQSGIGLLTDPVTNISQNVPTVTGGNAALKPEIGKTLALGGVIKPSFLPGFSLSVDYYNLKINGAIGTLNTAQTVQNCFSDASAPECGLITRPTPTSFPTLVRLSPANISFLKTSGIDFDATYTTSLGAGRLTTRLYLKYLDNLVTQQSATAPAYDYVGYGNNSIGRPRWRGVLNVNYATEHYSVFVSEQYYGGMKVGSPEPNQNYGGARIPSVWTTDLTLTANIKGLGGALQPFLTINNLFDKQPPMVPGTIPGVNLPTIFSLYDTVGRAYTAGVRFKF